MKKNRFFMSFCFIGVLFLFLSQAQAQQTDWEVFGKNLVKAIQTGNEGLQQSAMQLIIRHADNLDVDAAGLDILHIFRKSKNPKVRQLAMITLFKMQHKYAMFYLKRNLEFEKNDCIRKQCCCILKEYQAMLEREQAPASEKPAIAGR
ncbi:MAG: hypothetical protein KDE62_04675 [Calditrichaeota bacterium]|nr:hypothetical protein [Calditrichota bacterium]